MVLIQEGEMCSKILLHGKNNKAYFEEVMFKKLIMNLFNIEYF